ncbi:WXG100 family type VII secretion target [Leifsonia sp. NPDC058248]|uniref:WXG100 family type VII secretion target n=1 Tax=Leifsonia sp. NPDC058248 TaxID=3346402 RepID=UPI0036D7C305
MGEIVADPGVGEPAGIRALARERSAKAVELRAVHADVVAAEKTVTGSAWTGKAQAAFTTAMDAVAPDLLLLSRGLEAQASALHDYAGQVQQIKDQQKALEARRRSATDALTSARALLAASHRADDRVLAQERALDRDVRTSSILASRAGYTETIAENTSLLTQVDTQWEHLVTWRRHADQACMSGLSGPEVLGRTAPFTPAVIRTSAPDALLRMLTGLSATDLIVLLQTHPDLADKLTTADPPAVAAWWTAMNGPTPGTPSAEQLALITAIPTIIGNLNGLPALVRVAANKLNAEGRIAHNEALIARLRAAGNQLSLAAGAHVDGYAGTVEQLEKELKYLRDAVGDNPTVQLYLFQPEKSRIIEMLGTPSADTARAITYVPGTFTNLNAFYSKRVQQFAAYLVAAHPREAVAFVYKDGVFPGASDASSAADFSRIGEANDLRRTAAAGAQLADFSHGISLDPLLTASRTTAIGHSWGLANIAASEVAGSGYSQVVSLSGAGMPARWRPSPTTRYTDHSYYDLLQEAQQTGVVWAGNTPNANSAFEKFHYEGPVDPVVSGPFGLPVWVDQGALLANHNLVATDSKANRQVQADVEASIFG